MSSCHVAPSPCDSENAVKLGHVVGVCSNTSHFLPLFLVHAISHFWPLEVFEFLLTSTMTPSDRRIRVRTRSFQSLSYGSLTE